MTSWTDAYLDQMRLVGDPLSDDLVKRLFEENLVTQFNEIIQALDGNEQTVKAGLSAIITLYMAKTIVLPQWFDMARYQRARVMFAKYELQIMAALLLAGLPGSYAAAKGAHVLVQTYRFTHNPHRRMLETVQLLRDLMAEDGLGNGNGRRSLQKVRLLHAATRYLLRRDGNWDTAYYGVPINQEDMAGTAIVFSAGVIHTLPRLGVQLTDQEKADYLYVWRCFGAMMGIDLALLPAEMSEAQLLAEHIARRHFSQSEDGMLLTRSLLDMIAHYLPLGFPPALSSALIRYLVGDEVADMLGLERHLWDSLIKPLAWAQPLLHSHQALTLKAAEMLFLGIYQSHIIQTLDQKRASYTIPAFLNPFWKAEQD